MHRTKVRSVGGVRVCAKVKRSGLLGWRRDDRRLKIRKFLELPSFSSDQRMQFGTANYKDVLASIKWIETSHFQIQEL